MLFLQSLSLSLSLYIYIYIYMIPIKLQNVTRLCHTKSLVSVNKQFPGPRIVASGGDRLLIKVVNYVHNNISIHCGWADGPAYITQCPIQTGQSYVYNFTILRSTLYGPIIILPKQGTPYPFVKPHKQVPIIFGEWLNADTEAIISQALQTGGGPNVSDAYTINGLPGRLYNCSAKANHTFKVVEVDAVYVKPFDTETLLITPGQTTNVLLNTKSHYPSARFLMNARPYVTGLGTFDNSTVAGILEYEKPPHSRVSIGKLRLFKPILPPLNDTSFATNFTNKLHSLASAQFPANVPQNVDKRFFFTVPNGTMFQASVNNISFVMPTTSLLQSHYSRKSNGVYSPYFPIYLKIQFNYTGTPPNNTMVSNGTKLVVLPFNTYILGAKSHPLHLHGFNFFVVGQGFGNFDPNKDPAKFNLVDPVERNIVGVWFMHCHLEVHTSWGLKMAWIVLDGNLPNQKLLPPPADLPKC
ncbi:hypothetical protein ACOSQ2_016822 [Xanthoceras sorbifolium]